MYIKIKTKSNNDYFTQINDIWRAKQILGEDFISWEKLNSWKPVQGINNNFCGDTYYEWVKGKK